MTYELTSLFVACSACEETDQGPCPECHGECLVEIEASHEATEEAE